jgi:hypothetical protein
VTPACYVKNSDNDSQAICTNELRICIKGMTKRLIDIDEDALADLAGFNLDDRSDAWR